MEKLSEDMGIHSEDDDIRKSAIYFLTHSHITVVSDKSTGGILLSLRYNENSSRPSPFYQYVFGQTCESRVKQAVNEIYVKFILFKTDTYDDKYQFAYKISSTELSKVLLYSITKKNMVTEYNLHVGIFEKNFESNVEHWVNVPSPITLLIYQKSVTDTLQMMSSLRNNGDRRVKELITKIENLYIQHDKCHIGLFFMEKINGRSLFEVETQLTTSVVRNPQPNTNNVVDSIINYFFPLPPQAPVHRYTLEELQHQYYQLRKKKPLNNVEEGKKRKIEQIVLPYYNLYVYELYKMYANRTGYIHGDSHFGNVLYDSSKDKPFVYLIDFGRSYPVSYFQESYDEMIEKIEEIETDELLNFYKENELYKMNKNIFAYNEINGKLFSYDDDLMDEFMMNTHKLLKDSHNPFISNLPSFISTNNGEYRLRNQHINWSHYESMLTILIRDHNDDYTLAKQWYNKKRMIVDNNLNEYTKIKNSHVYVYFTQLRPQLEKYQLDNPSEKLKVEIIDSLVLNYVCMETNLDTHSIFTTEYLDIYSYQLYFYFYIQPIFDIRNDEIRIIFTNPKLEELVNFVRSRLQEDVERSLNFYCERKDLLCSPNTTVCVEEPPEKRMKSSVNSSLLTKRTSLGGKYKKKKSKNKKKYPVSLCNK